MRKAQDDPIARTVAENQLTNLLDTEEAANPEGSARTILGAFKAVEFDRAIRMVGDEEINLRRLVLTTAWEVDPNGGK